MDTYNEIVVFFADNSEEEIRDEFTGMSQNEILGSINVMWPQDDNAELARKIYEWLN